jgi:competence protein ComEC
VTRPRLAARLQRLAFTALLLCAPAGVAAAKPLEIYFIDVEGGQATLVLTPAGESVLIDAGYGGRVGGRDAGRILEAMRDAGIDRLDFVIVTHFHPDHAGGVAELAAKVPIATFIDYGEPLGTDRMATGSFRSYEPVRRRGLHLRPAPGDRLPIAGLDVHVVSAGGTLTATPLEGGGQANGACVDLEDHPEDGTENYRSLGVMLRFGAFRFLDLGDLSGNTLTRLVCPTNLVGTASVYLISHHGDYDSNIPALYAAVRPRVAIMNNGVLKGGSPVAFRTVRAERSVEDLWQLHASRNEGVTNGPDDLIANIDDGATAYWIKLTASEDGAFRVVNARTGFTKSYPSTVATADGDATSGPARPESTAMSPQRKQVKKETEKRD